jgi:glucosyl-dolichyl phosphate glucuronosyltransferase
VNAVSAEAPARGGPVTGRDPLLEVVICTYDNASGLDRTLDALSRSRPAEAPWRVVVVDNNSTDDTAQVVERHRRLGHLPGLTRVGEPIQGLTWARLRGVRSTTAPWIAFVDDDCVVDERWVERTVAFAQRAGDAGGFGGRVVLRHEEAPPPVLARYGWAFAEQDLGDAPVTVDCLVGTGMVLNRAALEASGWTEGPLLSDRIGRRLVSGGDVELALRVASTGRPLWYVPDCGVAHEIPARRTSTRYLVRIIVGLGISHSLALALTWGGSRRGWLRAAVRQAVPPLVEVLRLAKGGVRGPTARMDALLAASFEWGRWVGLLRVARMLATGRCPFFGRAAARPGPEPAALR